MEGMPIFFSMSHREENRPGLGLAGLIHRRKTKLRSLCVCVCICVCVGAPSCIFCLFSPKVRQSNRGLVCTVALLTNHYLLYWADLIYCACPLSQQQLCSVRAHHAHMRSDQAKKVRQPSISTLCHDLPFPVSPLPLPSPIAPTNPISSLLFSTRPDLPQGPPQTTPRRSPWEHQEAQPCPSRCAAQERREKNPPPGVWIRPGPCPNASTGTCNNPRLKLCHTLSLSKPGRWHTWGKHGLSL
ncbi:unnamed protein product [Discosporangium mesarthrocarpum]